MHKVKLPNTRDKLTTRAYEARGTGLAQDDHVTLSAVPLTTRPRPPEASIIQRDSLLRIV
jgi:hypothetical protein